MLNIHASNENGRTLPLVWFVTSAARPEPHSHWAILDSPLIVEGILRGPGESRNQSLTKSWDTQTIAACA